MRAIGLVSHFPPPPGGMPGQAQELACGLEREGIRVIPIRTNLSGGRLIRWLDGIRYLRTVVRVPMFVLRLVLALPRVDLLHILSCSGTTFFVFTAPAVALGRLLRRGIILHYHGGAAEQFLRRWPRFSAWVLRRADAILVPSGFLAEVFRGLGWEVVQVPNICDTGRFGPGPPRRLAPRFIVARHLEPDYNVACGLRAFALVRKRYPEAVLTVLGGGSEEARLKQLAEELGLGGSVRFLGYVDHDQVPAIYSESSIFLNSSNCDNTPVSILEAFAAGLPVVSTKAGGIPYLVEHGTTGLLVGLDDEAGMAEQIFALLERTGLAEHLINNARDVAADYAWPRVFRKLKAVYATKSPGQEVRAACGS
jgi:phenylacetate-CoA ligase